MSKARMLSVVVGSALALSASFGAQAQDLGSGTGYASLKGGITFLNDADNSGTGFNVGNSFDDGGMGLGALGWKWRNGFRAEAEVSYRSNDVDTIDSISVAGTGAATGLNLAAEGEMTALALMFNGAFDFDTGTRWVPFITAGAGVARVSFDDAKIAGIRIVDDEDEVFAYQGGLGLSYQFTDAVSAGLSYRYFATMDPDLSAVDGTGFESEYESHNVLAGLTFNF